MVSLHQVKIIYYLLIHLFYNATLPRPPHPPPLRSLSLFLRVPVLSFTPSPLSLIHPPLVCPHPGAVEKEIPRAIKRASARNRGDPHFIVPNSLTWHAYPYGLLLRSPSVVS